jgi:two-component system response regulator RstA
MDAHRLLVVEDDVRLGKLVAEYLDDHGFVVSLERRGDRAVDRILSEQPDLVVLDVMLPGLDGFEVFRRICRGFLGRVLFLTARQSDVDHVAGLEMGADDYVTKPVDPRVLLARIHALLRRPGAPVELGRATVGALSLDRGRREARVGDAELVLTSAEFDLLWMLASRAGQVVSRSALYPTVLGQEYDGVDRGIDVHVSRIRRKLKDIGLDGDPIKSVRGAGYQLVVPR